MSPQPACCRRVSTNRSLISSLSASWRGLVDRIAGASLALTHREIALLLVISLNPEPHITLSLAVRLSVSRSVVLRALGRLSNLGYIDRTIGSDRRVLLFRATEVGRSFLVNFAESLRPLLRLH